MQVISCKEAADLIQDGWKVSTSGCMGSLTAGGLLVEAREGRLHVLREGRMQKVVNKVDHLSFNRPYTVGRGTEVMYVTERAVFELRDSWLTLTEIAPVVDPERDVEAQLAAHVPVAPDLKPMDARIFRDAPMLRGCDTGL